MAPCEFLYGGNWRSPIHWDEEGEKKVLGPKIVKRMVQVIDKIRVWIKVAQDRQKSYADKKREDLEFQVEDKVNLKVALMKCVLRLGKKETLRT